MVMVGRLLGAWSVGFGLSAIALAGCGGGGGGTSTAATSSLAVVAPTPAPTLGPTPAGTNPSPAATGTSPGGTGEAPYASDAFVDSAGVNVHLASGASLYANPGAVQSSLATLGVRHIRDGAAIGQSSVCAAEVQLAASGVHLDLVTSTQWSVAVLTPWLACLGSAVETVEGPNEYDLSNDPHFAATLGAYMQLLYPAMKPLPIVSPSLTTEAAFVAVGSLATSVDYGNMHQYFAGRNPGTTGWGGTDAYGTYATIAYGMNLAAITSGGKPVISTETGYSDDPTDEYAVPAATKARYIARTLLEDWNAGVTRTYLYELADDGGTPFSHYGLVDGLGNPKPAYVMLKNLLAHLSDPGGTFATARLNYSLSAPATIHHVLLEQRTGRYHLVLWVEASEWDPTTGHVVTVAPQTATLKFAHAPSALTSTVFDDAGNVSTTAINAGTVTITASPTIVDITP